MLRSISRRFITKLIVSNRLTYKIYYFNHKEVGKLGTYGHGSIGRIFPWDSKAQQVEIEIIPKPIQKKISQPLLEQISMS